MVRGDLCTLQQNNKWCMDQTVLWCTHWAAHSYYKTTAPRTHIFSAWFSCRAIHALFNAQCVHKALVVRALVRGPNPRYHIAVFFAGIPMRYIEIVIRKN